MGSLDNAFKTGFICRLCSEMNKVVIHIFSDVGQNLKLAERIHEHLPITVTVTDPLPKTVCWNCITKLQQQHIFVQRVAFGRQLNKKDELKRAPQRLNNTPSLSGSTVRGLRIRERNPEDPAAQPGKNLNRQ